MSLTCILSNEFRKSVLPFPVCFFPGGASDDSDDCPFTATFRVEGLP